MENYFGGKNRHRNYEVKSVIDSILYENKQIITLKEMNNEFYRDKVKKFLKNIEYRESPDGISFIDNTACIVEHFAFDCSKNTGKGSEFQQKAGKNFKETFGKSSTSTATISSNDSIEYYFDNLKYAFDKHCKNRKKYETNLYNDFHTKNNIVNKTTKYSEVFVIEDCSLAVYYYNENSLEWEPYNICQSKEFLRLWNEHKEIDYILLYTNLGVFFMKYIDYKSTQSYKDVKTICKSGGCTITSKTYSVK